MNPSLHDHKYQRSLADRGAFIEYDMIGMDYFYADQQAQSPCDEENAVAICKLVEDGYLNSILMSQDVFLKMMLTRYGGFGYGYILKHFVPRLRRHGMDSARSTTSCSKTRVAFSLPSIARADGNRKGGAMADKRYNILLAGESWVTTATHIKGFDQFPTVTFHLGAEPLVEALKGSAFDLRYMPGHEAQRDFPQTPEGLAAYDAVILSDIGANTLLLHPDTWIASKRTPNRLRSLKTYVERGGGLMMVGGYYSFQGINGGARYHGTAVEEVLPVEILPYDDRIEVPEGFTPIIKDKAHPILAGFTGEWPPLLGFNEVRAKPAPRCSRQLRLTMTASRSSSPEHSAGAARSRGRRTSGRMAAGRVRRMVRILPTLASGVGVAGWRRIIGK